MPRIVISNRKLSRKMSKFLGSKKKCVLFISISKFVTDIIANKD